MKKFTLQILLGLFVMMGTSIVSFGQTKDNQPVHNHNEQCGTMHWHEEMMREYPEYARTYAENEKRLGDVIRKKQAEIAANPGSRTNVTYTIPTVFHIVLTNPSIITDAMVQNQLNVLNRDFNGTNADSTNATAFYNIRGHSNIQFCLAKRTPTNQPTTGIVRVTSSTVSAQSTNDPIKSTAAGGSDAWDPTKYFNVWLCNFSNTSLLGYATFPIGTPENPAGPLNQQGVTVLAQSVPGGTAAPYNLGRTATHEAGHFFWLRHINGDGACLDDFPNTPGIDDTPQQNNLTSGCPSGAVAPGCAASPNPPGRNYQNYMDYTDDACMTMFTNGQGTRAENALLTYRLGLTTSNGCTPPNVFALDASISSITNPTANQGFCGVTSVTPIVQLTNSGSTTLTSATITTQLDAGVPTSTPWSGSLASFASISVTLPAVNSITPGNHTLTICVTSPNGGVDLDATNNCKTVTFSIISGGSGGILPPVFEGFESTTYPSAGWTLTIPTGQVATTPPNWDRQTPGNGGKTGAAASRIKWWSFANGRIHFMNLPVVNFSSGNFDSALMTFHYAFKAYNATSPDSLAVQISTDCGNTWISLWERGRQGLASATGFQTSEYLNPLASDWTQTPISINLTAYKNGPIYLRFRARSGFGNNLFLDDINLFGKNLVNNDASVSVINSPIAEFCGATFTPQVVVKNEGILPLSSVRVGYRVNANTVANQAFTFAAIPKGGTVTLTLNPYTGAINNGANIIRAYTSLPNAVVDQAQSNDSLSKPFVANLPVTLPLVEGFESTTFPPAGWRVINPNAGSITWARTAASRKSGTASAYVNFYNYNNPGQLDYLRSPIVSFNPTFDSSLMTFQYAYKLFSNGFLGDTLSVVVSTNCGVSWSAPVWKRGGSELTTAGGFETGNWFATAAQWTTVPVTVDLAAFRSSGPIFIALLSRTGYGQNVFVDDINIYEKLVPNYDLTIPQVVDPFTDICDVPFTPRVRVANVGKITTTSFNLHYTIDGGAVVTQAFTGQNIVRNANTLVSLNPINSLSIGAHVIKFYTSLPNGQADQAPANDTLTLNVVVKQSVNAPLVESFEGATFPPALWEIGNGNNDRTWEKFTNPKLVASDGVAAAGFRNRNYALTGRTDMLTTPVLRFTSNDTTILRFDVSAVAFQYPGSTSIPLDTLEVQTTIDCGKTWTSSYKKWGDVLQTVSDPNFNYTDSFFTARKSQWRTDSINMGTILSSGGIARARWINKGFNGNNIFIDKVNLYSKTLAAKLKNNGFMIVPNPVRNVFAIQHFLPPTNLRGIGFFNSAGQRLMYFNFNGNADSYIPIDISRFAAGVYTIKLEYTNRTVAERIIKL